ncbi:MAG: indolepyruvate oxidoreductase subunit beta [Thermodesulfobacteriota bacterium]|nr:indolepyruvate oxidoreductase subunit beta [Thermodesulfobacteriota bacterium]
MNILLAGVGGQGIILASDMLSETMMRYGLDVKKSEIHGMAQRGGSVMSHVRFGNCIASPTIPMGKCDILCSFEELETARYMDYITDHTRVIINRFRLNPPAVIAGDMEYPSIEGIISGFTSHVSFVDASGMATDMGNPKGVNIILLGIISAFLEPEEALWTQTLGDLLKEKIRKINIEGFLRGRSAGMDIDRSL